MKWALSGTPGTGKTIVSNIIERKGYKILRLNDITDRFTMGYDYERDSMIIDDEKLDQYVSTLSGDIIIEGHLSHLLTVNGVIILRCNPIELKQRLKTRNWSEKKIQENVEAEVLDIILERALERHKNIWEIDTTGKKAIETAEELERIVTIRPPANYGNIDWSKWVMDHA